MTKDTNTPRIQLPPEALRREFVPVHHRVHYEVVRYLLAQAALQFYFSLRLKMEIRGALGFADDEALKLLGLDSVRIPAELRQEIFDMLTDYSRRIDIEDFSPQDDGDKIYNLFIGLLNKYAEPGKADYFIPDPSTNP